MTETLENLTSLRDIHCPECNGVPNREWFCWFNALDQVACFIVECWSGDLNIHSNYHLFKVLIAINGEVTILKEEKE